MKRKTKKRPKKPPVRCRHAWVWESHNDYRDGEFWTCSKCGKVKWP